MAFPTDNLDSYTSGDSLVGLNGGTGWSGAWAGKAGTGDAIVRNTQSDTASNSFSINFDTAGNGNSEGVIRSFPNTTVGTFSFAFRTDGNEDRVRIYNGTTEKIRLRLSNIVRQHDGSLGSDRTLVSGLSTSAWHTITVEIDQSAQPGKARVKVDSTQYDWYDMVDNSGSNSTLNLLNVGGFFNIDYPQDFYWDSFSGGSAGPTSSIKSINGLAIASVKSVNGLAIASVKSFNGLSNVS